LNLKGCFEKGLKKKRKKRNSPHLPFAPVAQQPINPSPAAAHSRHLFFFFLSFADDPAPPVSGSLHLPFFFPPPLPRPVQRRRDPRRARPLPFPFLLARAGQLRRHFLAFKSGRFPFPPLLPEMPAAFNGKRGPPLAPSASSLSLSLSLGCYLRSSPSSRFPLCPHTASTRARSSPST
jgi:hypothetical protein